MCRLVRIAAMIPMTRLRHRPYGMVPIRLLFVYAVFKDSAAWWDLVGLLECASRANTGELVRLVHTAN